MFLVVLCLASLLAGEGVAATTFVLEHRLARTTTSFAPQLGYAAAITGQGIFVGAPFDDTAGTDAGLVHVFDAAEGSFVTTFRAPNAVGGEQFGFALSARGAQVVVGSPGDDTVGEDAGALFLLDGQISGFVVPNPVTRFLGAALPPESGAMVVAGAPLDDVAADGAGSAYLFPADLGLPAVVRAPAPRAGDLFGAAVAVGDSTFVVGAPLARGEGADTGAAYVFALDGGVLMRTLTPPDASAGDAFGGSLAVVGSSVVVGAPLSDAAGPDAGAVFLFDLTTGELLRSFTSPAPSGGGHFGLAVAARGTTLLVGAPGENRGAGIVYQFDPNRAARTLDQPSGTVAFGFSLTLATQSGLLVVGAPLEEGGAGAAYLFRTAEDVPVGCAALDGLASAKCDIDALSCLSTSLRLTHTAQALSTRLATFTTPSTLSPAQLARDATRARTLLQRFAKRLGREQDKLPPDCVRATTVLIGRINELL